MWTDPGLRDRVVTMTSERPRGARSTEVPGQFYGYSIQTTRMAVHLLEAGPDETVCLEFLDDVATIAPDGRVIAEQSKSSFAANPVSDRAVPVWKTLSNWVDAVRSGKLLAQRTAFRLHLAQPHECGMAIEMLRRAATDADAVAALDYARSMWWGPSPSFPARVDVPPTVSPYIENIFTSEPAMVARIVSRFTVDIGAGDSIDEVRLRLGRQIVSADLIDDFLTHALGWVHSEVHRLIEAGSPVAIGRNEFFAALHAYVRKYDRALALPPWAAEPHPGAIDEELRSRHYIEQLEIIDAEADEKIEAATDFLKSVVDRTRWAERGDVHRASFVEFEHGLVRQWNARRKDVELSWPDLPEVSRGKLVYARCEQHQAKLQGMEPTEYFTRGCYHALAETLSVGWHPRYRDELGRFPMKKTGS